MRMTATTALEPPEVLAWDSEFWGLRVAKAPGYTDDLTAWATANTVGLVCLLVDTPEEAQRAEANGYRLMDVRVTYERRTRHHVTATRRATRDDVDELARIARESHRVTRFYADPRLPDERCDDLYDGWIRQSCAGWADAVLVVPRFGATPAGYVTVHADAGVGAIGLIAVAEDRRKVGHGGALVYGALSHAHAVGCHTMRVVTQGRNVAAQRLFQRCGFRITKTEMWLHGWMDV